MKRELLFYTFRTFKQIKELEVASQSIVVLGKLKEDIQKVEELLLANKYFHIIGIANHKKTLIETKAINKFNNGVIHQHGVEEYKLDLIPELDLKIHNECWTTFCNWAAYKVAQLKALNNIQTPHSFVHTTIPDAPFIIQRLCECITEGC